MLIRAHDPFSGHADDDLPVVPADVPPVTVVITGDAAERLAAALASITPVAETPPAPPAPKRRARRGRRKPTPEELDAAIRNMG